MSNLADLSAVELVSAYKAKSLSPVEVTEAVIARIEAYEPKLNALWAYDPDAARAAAKASEARWSKGEPAGPIDGVPLTIKENIATEGTPVPLGCAALPLKPAAADAPPAARSREAGGVLLAKTTMPDLGMLSSGLSSFHKLARNPWDLNTNPGGSSAGAGSAAAAGYGPLHIGTDIGGSIRLPAGWCGLVGLKPSFGRIPIDPPFLGRVAGPMTRTVADSALYMSVLSRPDRRDAMSLPYQDIDWMDLNIDVKGLKIGLWLDAGFGEPTGDETRAAVEAAAKAFADAGAIIEPVAPFLNRTMIDGLDRFWRARSWSDIKKMTPENRAKILPYIYQWTETAEGLSGEEVYLGFAQMDAMRNAALAASKGFDFIISPTAPMPTYPAEWASPVNDPQRPFEHIAFTVAMNMSEQPAISINCGYTSKGLPIGLQIFGQRFDDLGVLRLARAYEEMRPVQRPWPVIA
ncbi:MULTISPECIES: amidase [Brucella/Ochrobactrum group]|uniref:Amidase n=1 Tax=Brucella pseudintermedia TaxID=370111 RepID=A0ABY5UB13_9HYPH|nr:MULTISPECIES: amidase [Brucella/Ochrobactrum group]KAB2678395.1 amidase [Brucella pseudintermedia]NKE76473.1 amidase [Ochrobactrum sp. MC-1LL]TWH01694.1 aspartyl-tRNA(Asn)/glutamyl-tRNA(Gln) amidotransferase subunit A [Ochrobactrum sp. J50]UWL59219.1 amidase [Brucella pseudintermedia]WPM79653.1 amidase [Brucella pseudintermedia]